MSQPGDAMYTDCVAHIKTLTTVTYYSYVSKQQKLAVVNLALSMLFLLLPLLQSV